MKIFRMTAVALPLLAASFAPAAELYDFPTPLYDRWQYPFDGQPGSRPTMSMFSSMGTGVASYLNFNNRDGIVIIAWDTTSLIPAGLGVGNYDVSAVTVTVTNDPEAVWQIDLSADEWYQYDVNNDTFVNGDGVPRGQPGDTDGESSDADPGRALELFGTGFGPFFDTTSWNEFSAYVGGTNLGAAPRDPFPFTYQAGTGNVLHVEDNVLGRWNTAYGVTNFTPVPWAIGVPLGYTPGAQTEPFDVVYEVNLDLSEGRVRDYFAEQLDAGRVFVTITSLTDTILGGTPGGFPLIYAKEAVGAIPGAKAPLLSITLGSNLPADLNGDGCVDLIDLSILLSNFGMFGGATAEQGDITGDGNIDLSDLSELLVVFGSGVCP